MRHWARVGLAWGLLAAGGCGEATLSGPGELCVRASQCMPGLACVAGACSTDLSGVGGTIPSADAGNMMADAGPPSDAGPRPDAGPQPDAGPELDAGPPPADSGPPPTDSGPPPVDSGPPPVDSGPPPIDSGPPSDSGAASDGGA